MKCKYYTKVSIVNRMDDQIKIQNDPDKTPKTKKDSI